ncbi:MAG TPA: ABC transporter permease subunit [Candidatus Limnocylindrales bacterium]
MSDLLTVCWKEVRELLHQSGSVGRTLRNLAFMLAVFGVFLPWEFGRALVDSPAALLPWVWVPFMLVSGVVADSFAGERERHTLETLLASRLPDDAILLGKVITAALYGWGFALVSAAIGLATVNVTHAEGTLLLYPPELLVGLVVFGLLGSLLMATAGVLVSLRAATTRQAAQTLSLAIVGLLFVPIVALQLLPGTVRLALVRFVAGLDMPLTASLAAIGLIAADMVLLGLALARFRRASLLLD